MLIEQSSTVFAVGFVSLVDLEVIAPTAELEAIVAEGLRLLAHRFNWEVGPLAGEECYWT